MKDLVLVKKFNDFKQAFALTEQLKKVGIQYKLKDEKSNSEFTSANDSPEQNGELLLFVDKSDFERVTKILEINAEVLLKEIDENHYLYEFTKEELIDILLTPDKWGKFDYLLAQKILIDRGEVISNEQLMAFRQKRLDDLAQPDKRQIPWIIAGYIFALLGGFLGLIIGWSLWKIKKTLPNGEKVYAFMYPDRIHGKLIFLIGIIIFPIALILGIIDRVNN